MSEDEWMRCEDVAARWKLTPREVQRMVARGQIPHLRVGRLIRISARAVADFERAHTQRARSRAGGR
jgi:excisionase family DNA binding protein